MKKALVIVLVGLLLIVAGCQEREVAPTPEPMASPTEEAATPVQETAEATTEATMTGTPEAPATEAPASPTASLTILPTETPLINTPTPTVPPLANIPAFEGMALLYHVEGGIAGLCQDLAIFQDAQALFGPCGGLRSGQLDDSQLEQLDTWLEMYAPFTLRMEDNPGGPDNMITSLFFAGQGSEIASETEQQEIVDWTRSIYAKLAGGTLPPAAVSEDAQRTAILTEPNLGTAVTSPLEVAGEAINYGKPLIVRVQDEKGDTIGQTLAEVDAKEREQGPFSAEVVFTQPPRDQMGRIVILAVEGESATPTALISLEVELTGSGADTIQVSTPRLRVFQGPGFSLPYLADSVVEHVAGSQWKLAGRSIAVQPAQGDWVWQGPAYVLTIFSHDNPDGANSMEWTRSHLLDAWRTAKANNAPFGGPVNDEGEIQEEGVQEVRLGDWSAMQVDWQGGDHIKRTVYLALPERVIAFSYDIFPQENYPLAPAAQDILGLMLAQVEAAEAEGTPSTTPLVEGVRAFVAPGFYILVAANAATEEVEEDHWQISGPAVDVRAAEGEWAWDGPAYQLDLILNENPDQLTASEWARKSLLEAWEQARADETAFTGPVDQAGELIPSRVAEITIGGEPAFQADWRGTDSLHRVVYIRAGAEILAVHYNFFPAEIHPLGPMANAAHALSIASLRAGP